MSKIAREVLASVLVVISVLGPTGTSVAAGNLRDKGLVDMGAEYAWSVGFTGKGAVIAIIDTGIDPDSSYIAGQVIDGYCVVAQNIPESCSNGSKEMVGLAAANRIRDTDEHGMGMAGLVAGLPSASAPGGIAPEAKVIMLQAHGGDVEVLKALQQVLKFREKYNIVAVSMSFGRTAYEGASRRDFFGPCDEVRSLQEMKSVLTELRRKGVMPFAAAGNVSSKNDHLNQAPACLSAVVDIGATNTQNEVATYVTAAEKIELLAPDYVVTETNSGFRVMSGTSVATPLAAGAYALMRQAYPRLNPEEILDLLKRSGTPIADPYISSKPLVNLKGAIELAGGASAGDPSGTSRPLICDAALKGTELKWVKNVKYIKVKISSNCDTKISIAANGQVIKEQSVNGIRTVTAKVDTQQVMNISVSSDGFTIHEIKFPDLKVDWKRVNSKTIKVVAGASSFGEIKLGSKVVWRGILNPKGTLVSIPSNTGKTAVIYVNGFERHRFSD